MANPGQITIQFKRLANNPTLERQEVERLVDKIPDNKIESLNIEQLIGPIYYLGITLLSIILPNTMIRAKRHILKNFAVETFNMNTYLLPKNLYPFIHIILEQQNMQQPQTARLLINPLSDNRQIHPINNTRPNPRPRHPALATHTTSSTSSSSSDQQRTFNTTPAIVSATTTTTSTTSSSATKTQTHKTSSSSSDQQRTFNTTPAIVSATTTTTSTTSSSASQTTIIDSTQPSLTSSPSTSLSHPALGRPALHRKRALSLGQAKQTSTGISPAITTTTISPVSTSLPRSTTPQTTIETSNPKPPSRSAASSSIDTQTPPQTSSQSSSIDPQTLTQTTPSFLLSLMQAPLKQTQSADLESIRHQLGGAAMAARSINKIYTRPPNSARINSTQKNLDPSDEKTPSPTNISHHSQQFPRRPSISSLGSTATSLESLAELSNFPSLQSAAKAMSENLQKKKEEIKKIKQEFFQKKIEKKQETTEEKNHLKIQAGTQRSVHDQNKSEMETLIKKFRENLGQLTRKFSDGIKKFNDYRKNLEQDFKWVKNQISRGKSLNELCNSATTALQKQIIFSLNEEIKKKQIAPSILSLLDNLKKTYVDEQSDNIKKAEDEFKAITDELNPMLGKAQEDLRQVIKRRGSKTHL